jgi:ribosomal protein S4
MKKFLLPIFTLLSVSAFAQSMVTEGMVAIDGKSRNSLSVIIKDATADDVKKAWKKQLKDLKGKVTDKTIIFGDDCQAKSMGDNTFDVYSMVEDLGQQGIRLVAAFNLGGAYLSTASHPEKYPAAEQIMKQFALEQAKAVIKNEIDVSEKILRGFEKDLSGLEKDKEKLEKDIEDYEKKIEEAKAAIEQNVSAQANKKTEIEGMKAVIKDLQTKEKSIK